MWVQMMETISGGRPNGEPWPPAGYLLECEDAEGNRLIASRLAQKHTPPAKEKPEQKHERHERHEQHHQAEAKPAEAGAEAEKPEVLPVPHPSAPVQAWRDYAVSKGADPREVAGLSKAQLQQVYGGRL